MLFSKSDEAAFNYQFENCLIRFNDFNNLYAETPEYDFDNPTLFENSILNEDPVFKATELNQLQIGEESAANGLANPSTVTVQDILGTTREH